MKTFLPIFFMLVAFATNCIAQNPTAEQLSNWHHWRGPFANGSVSSKLSPATVWNEAKNVKWTVELPGTGTSTPIIWDDRIFVLSAKETDRKSATPPVTDEQSKTVPPDVYYQFFVTCVARSTGEVLWQKIAVEEVPHEGHHPTHTYAGSSPTTDGKRLYVSFGSRGVFCYSLAGELLWKTDLGNMKTRYGWGEAVTPVIHGDFLVINWDQEQGSFITCLDAVTGKEKWRTERPTEVTSWNTPLIADFADRQIVVVNGTDKVRAYELTTGKELWSCGGQTVNAIPSPIRFLDNVIVMSGYRGAFATSIPLDSTGDVSGSELLKWQHNRGTPYVPSPLLSGHRLFFTGGNGNILTVLNATDGSAIGEPRRMSAIGNLYASPVAAGGYLYLLDRDGTCLVLEDNDALTVVSVNRLNDSTDASPVVVGDQLFIRSWSKLYCIAE
ncbi:MAG: PQQ-binding-like beta-propeller repeat protein [Fuerstiella sp.]